MPSVPIPKDAVVDTSIPIPDGSIFDRPKTPDSPSTAKEIPGRLKQAGRSIAEFAAGTALPIAASMAGPEGKLAQVGAQAAAGAATPFVEAGVSKLMGGNPAMPSLKDVIRSAAFTGGVAALGAIPEAGKGAKVAGQIKGLPEEAQTVGNVKQAMRNRDFWIQSGASPEQADQIVTMPQTDLEALTQQSVKAGQDFKGAFQQVLDHQRADFNSRYDAILPKESTIEPAPIGKAMITSAQGVGEHELSPAFRGWLQRKGAELDPMTATSNMIASKGIELPSGEMYVPGGGPRTTAPSLGNTGSKATPKIAGPMTPAQAQTLRTELRENIPSNPTNLDKKVANELNQKLTDTIHESMKPEQRAAFDALDAEYGRFQDTIKKLDPRSGKFGSQISDLLFDKQLSNPEQAVNFVRMAQAAEQAHPGEVMPQLRASFMDHVLSETKQAAQGRPVEEMRLIQNLQKQWGGDKNARAVMGAVFGADSPMANMTTASKVLGSLANPDAVAAKGAHTVLSDLAKGVTSHNFIVRLALFYGTYRAIAGGTGSPWKDLGDPEKMIPPLMAMMVGGKMADFALGAADTQIQKAYVDFLLNPNSKSLSNVTSVLGGIGGAASGRPTENAPANP